MSKETQKQEVAIFDVKKFSIAQLPELKNKKEEIAAIIEANPIVEIIDTETYDQAKKSRTAVKTLRTSLEKEQASVKKEIKTFIVDVVDTEYSSLVSDVKEHENKRQEAVTAYETKKEAEKAEKAAKEQQRIDNINNLMNDYVAEWKTAFNLMVFETIEEVGAGFLESYTNFDLTVLEEFESLFPAKIQELTEYLKEKSASLHEAEMARQEKIRLEAEAERIAKEKAELAEKQRIAAEAEAKAKKEREDFEREKAEFQEKKRLEEERLKAASEVIEAKILPETIKGIEVEEKAIESIQNIAPTETAATPEVLVPELPTVNVCNQLEEEPKTPAESTTTWESIEEDFKNSGEKSYSKWLKANYNVPTKIKA